MLDALKIQINHFRCVAAVMEKVDFPKEFWTTSLNKMLKELEAADHKKETWVLMYDDIYNVYCVQ